MTRPSRLNVIFEHYDQPVWFITANTAERCPWLAHDTVHLALLRFAEHGLEEGRAALGRYVLMPDHLHLFVRLAREEALGEWIKALKAMLARAASMAGAGVGRVSPRAGGNTTTRTSPTGGDTRPRPTSARWQAGFFDHLLRQRESYAQKWEYVRMNPVRAGLVQLPEDWPFQGEFHPLLFD